jgi:hypothetical protein
VKRAILAIALALLACSSAAPDQVTQMADEARKLAAHWHSDAQLVLVRLSGYGFVVNGGSLKSDNQPKQAEFYFFSADAPSQLLLAIRQFNFGAADQEMLCHRPDLAKMRALSVDPSLAPWRIAIPRKVVSPADALAVALESSFRADCAGVKPYEGCGNVTRAELHMFVVGNGQDLPVWRIDFGQNARAEGVVRLIDGNTGKLITNCTVPEANVALSDRRNLYLDCG